MLAGSVRGLAGSVRGKEGRDGTIVTKVEVRASILDSGAFSGELGGDCHFEKERG